MIEMFRPEQLTDEQLKQIVEIIEGINDIDLKLQTELCIAVGDRVLGCGSENRSLTGRDRALSMVLQEIGRRCR